MSNPPETALPVRHANGRFGPGNPGRRVGARNRLSHRVVMAILHDFELNKADTLDRLRRYHSPAYFAILTRMLDRELSVEAPGFDDYSEAEVARTLQLARSVFNGCSDPRTALIELDHVLVSQSSVDPAPSADR
jgi:hypothetical protein